LTKYVSTGGVGDLWNDYVLHFTREVKATLLNTSLDVFLEHEVPPSGEAFSSTIIFQNKGFDQLFLLFLETRFFMFFFFFHSFAFVLYDTLIKKALYEEGIHKKWYIKIEKIGEYAFKI
jgi:hypothetical protein